MAFQNRFYTYAYLNESNLPYYIGKGKGSRAYAKHCNVNVPDISKILILKRNLTEQEALKHEEYMISIYGIKSKQTGILENKLFKGSKNAIFYPTEDPDLWVDPVLTTIFSNKTAACILKFIYINEEAHGTMLAKIFGFGLNMTQRQLKRFEKNYILESRMIGNVRVYSFNKRHPTVKNLCNFLSTLS